MADPHSPRPSPSASAPASASPRYLESHLTPADLPVPALDVSALAGAARHRWSAPLAALLGAAIPARRQRPSPHPRRPAARTRARSASASRTFPIALAPPAAGRGRAPLHRRRRHRGRCRAPSSSSPACSARCPCWRPGRRAWPGSSPRRSRSKSASGDAQPGAPAQPHRADAQRAHHRRGQRRRGQRAGRPAPSPGGDAWVTHLFSRRRGGAQPGGADLRGAGEHRRLARRARGAAAALPLGGQRQRGPRASPPSTPPSYQSGGGLDVTTPARADALRAVSDGPAVLAPERVRRRARLAGRLLGAAGHRPRDRAVPRRRDRRPLLPRRATARSR